MSATRLLAISVGTAESRFQCLCLQNELAVLELIHCFVEVLDKHFGQVCELDIMNDPDVVSLVLNSLPYSLVATCFRGHMPQRASGYASAVLSVSLQ